MTKLTRRFLSFTPNPSAKNDVNFRGGDFSGLQQAMAQLRTKSPSTLVELVYSVVQHPCPVYLYRFKPVVCRAVDITIFTEKFLQLKFNFNMTVSAVVLHPAWGFPE